MMIDLDAMMHSTSSAMIATDCGSFDNPIIFVNLAFTVLTGYAPEEAIGRNCRFLQGPDTDPAAIAEIQQAVAAGIPIRREILNYRKDGTAFWNDLRIDPIRNQAGEVSGFVGVQYDITAIHLARDAAAKAERRLKSIVSNVPGFIFRRVMKPDGRLDITYHSPALNTYLGLGEDATINGKRFYQAVHEDDLPDLMAAIHRSAANLSVFHEEFRLVSTDGKIRWFRSDAPVRAMPNGDIVWDGLSIDITADKITQSELAFLAFKDPLTGLPNRINFKNSVLQAINVDQPVPKPFAMFFVDFQFLHEIKATLGQVEGDNLVQAIGGRLTELANDWAGTTARLGDNEFALLLPVTGETESVTAAARAIFKAFARPIQIAGQDISLEIYAGATLLVKSFEMRHMADKEAYAELMRQADLALQTAKQDAPGTFNLYTLTYDDDVRHRMVLRQSLHKAIVEEQFRLRYQPLVELASGRITGAEVLVRWQHPELGLQRPNQFIPLAEASGLIVPLGSWIIKTAMRQSVSWRRQGFKVPRVSINVSGEELKKPGFIGVVEQALAVTGADPKDFEFELTEGVLIQSSHQILVILKALKVMGFSIAIDDFGTGYSTFIYLRDFAVDTIKIDQTFVRRLMVNSSDAAIVRAMITLARSLGLKIVAEGIETSMHRDFLRDEGCETGQGYFFSVPLSAEDFGWLLQSGVTLPKQTEDAARRVRKRSKVRHEMLE